jgi:hypothetical protein
MNATYITVRDTQNNRSGNGGGFYFNEHDEVTGRVTSPVTGDKVQREGWGQHDYSQKRQARRAAKAYAAKRGIAYRQDKEYTYYSEKTQIVQLPVSV